VAHMSRKMLNHPLIHALFRARSPEQFAAIMVECGYRGTLEQERTKTYNKFMVFCNDIALANCVTAIHEFKTASLKNKTLKDAESQLGRILMANVGKIKHDGVREYFELYMKSFTFGGKIPDDDLFKIAKTMKYDNPTIGPIFYWYVLKQSEFATIKSIQMGLTLEEIKEAGLYERFE